MLVDRVHVRMKIVLHVQYALHEAKNYHTRFSQRRPDIFLCSHECTSVKHVRVPVSTCRLTVGLINSRAISTVDNYALKFG